jgi:hypothetical protein
LGSTDELGAMIMTNGLLSERATEIVRSDVPGGPSTSQTIMTASLSRLFELLPATAPSHAYRSAIMNENVLGKKTAGAREWAFRQLRRFYSLDPESLLFRALRDLWPDDRAGQPLLAILCAMARDPVLRASAPMVLGSEIGAVIGRDDFEMAIEEAFPGAYGVNTRRTTSQKLASSWNQSGHLKAESPTRKVRSWVKGSPTSMAYALLLGHLQDTRGEALFETLWAQVLDQPKSRMLDLASVASQKGMLEFRHSGGVMEIGFNHLLRPFDADQRALL